ncbi:2Fe-2S iron-sulfur cluster-binding protein [Pelodictyon luteolum]|uniref:Chlorosome envelope protein X n=1 Tax=Chlorobium luteolum (strain DSM 273 / BCRC 81028 / 2530) TaxID=319225 RepID=Q3B569_CHLL3|nr:2Fe-2S iron-sulfur cluster-binding protein [Pelodictyon luteolum]ABB23512.1 chlorosome envelope protein X [Pelodictyon luteolum DSM 273]
MKIIINDSQHEAAQGDRLIDVARSGHAHIGYFCGGNAICQTCYVKVLEGAELLSPPGEPEKAMLSELLLAEGNRMACLATIEKPGTIRVLSAVEEVKRMAETDPLQLPAYSAKMGWEALVAFPATIAMQFERTLEGHLDPLGILRDMAGAVIGAIELASALILGSKAGEEPASDCCQGQTGEGCSCGSATANGVRRAA